MEQLALTVVRATPPLPLRDNPPPPPSPPQALQEMWLAKGELVVCAGEFAVSAPDFSFFVATAALSVFIDESVGFPAPIAHVITHEIDNQFDGPGPDLDWVLAGLAQFASAVVDEVRE